MEAFEAAQIVYNRILKTETETITRKIIGYIYLLDHADREMIRLALSHDNLIQNLIQKAKFNLNLATKPIDSSLQFGPILQLNRPFSVPRPLEIPQPIPDCHLNSPTPYPHSVSNVLRYQNHDQFVALSDPFESYSQAIASLSRKCYSPDGNFSVNGRKDAIPNKICHYFNKGCCKHGNNCKFFHGDFNTTEVLGDDHQDALLSPGSLVNLEFEITEILKSRRGNPISIASLPMIYYERYGKSLQAEGYLTESQRHGKAGYSLTKLLARLKNSIRLIDRPHGQHSVVLAEDASRYIEHNHKISSPIASSSKQIYLTFPAESTFTEDDAAIYFSTFGPVQDVRIPHQENRMFGFVTFHNAETVQIVLPKKNPHYICGCRILVKPYRDKLNLFDRRYSEKLEAPIWYHTHMDLDLQARYESSSFLDRQIAKENELAIQLEMMRLAQLQLGQKPCQDQVDNSPFGSSKSGQDLNLPESPFACNKDSNKRSWLKYE